MNTADLALIYWRAGTTLNRTNGAERREAELMLVSIALLAKHPQIARRAASRVCISAPDTLALGA